MGPNFWKEVCDPHHLIIVILVLMVALLVTGAGRGIGGVISAFIKKVVGGKSVEINVVGGGSMAGERPVPKECEGCGLVIDPTKCVMHQSEHERSKRNEAQIAQLWEEYGKLRNENLAAAAKLKDEMTAGFEKVNIGFAKVNASINASNSQILSALAGNRNGFQGPGKGGSG
jgi:hypothetical protein